MSDHQSWNPSDDSPDSYFDGGKRFDDSQRPARRDPSDPQDNSDRSLSGPFPSNGQDHNHRFSTSDSNLNAYLSDDEEQHLFDDDEPVERDQLDLDRLVDGEVDLPELRRIVAELEDRPDGWRDCALAFLEAQALRKELSADAFQDFADDFAAAFSDERTSAPSHEVLAHQVPAHQVPAHQVPAHQTPSQQTPSQQHGEAGDFSPSESMNESEDRTDLYQSGRHRGSDDDRCQATSRNGSGIDPPEPMTDQAGEVFRWARRSRRAMQKRWDRFQQKPLWQRRLAIAASVAIAFLCGVAGRNWLAPMFTTPSRSNTAERPLIPGQSTHEPTSPRAGTTLVGNAEPRGHVSLAFADQAADSESRPNGSMGSPVDPPGEPPLPPVAPGIGANSAELTHGEPPTVDLPNPELEVPFYERGAFPSPESIVLPADVQDRLHRANVEIRSRRQLVRVQTASGETVLVPLETVDFVPRESRRYQ